MGTKSFEIRAGAKKNINEIDHGTKKKELRINKTDGRRKHIVRYMKEQIIRRIGHVVQAREQRALYLIIKWKPRVFKYYIRQVFY